MMLRLETPPKREEILCPRCQQLVAWRLPSGTIVAVGSRVTEDERGKVRIECPRCGSRRNLKAAA